MAETFRIEFDWLDCETGSELDRAFSASIGVAVGEEWPVMASQWKLPPGQDRKGLVLSPSATSIEFRLAFPSPNLNKRWTHSWRASCLACEPSV